MQEKTAKNLEKHRYLAAYGWMKVMEISERQDLVAKNAGS